MATGRERRAERLNERLRGAQRTHLDEDESFNIDISGLDFPAAAPSSSSHRISSSPAKRRKLNSDANSTPSLRNRSSSSAPRSIPSAPRNPYNLPDSSKELTAQPVLASSSPKNPESTPRNATVLRSTRSSSAAKLAAAAAASQQAIGTADESELLPTTSVISSVRSHATVVTVEEVGESPADAPGSGQRRRIRLSGAAGSTQRLQDALRSEGDVPASSSPLVRKVRRSDAAAIVRASQSSFALVPDEERIRALSEQSADGPDEHDGRDNTISEPVSVDEPNLAEDEVGNEDEGEPEVEMDEPEEAEEIGELEAAKALRKKRPRRTQPALSPELGSEPVEDQPDEDEDEPSPQPSPQPPKRKRGGRPSRSPANQKQPASKQKSTKPKKRALPRARAAEEEQVGEEEEEEEEEEERGDEREEEREETRAPKPQAKRAPRKRKSAESQGDDGAIEITVQRFVNYKRRQTGDDEDDDDANGADPLHSEIPFANHSGESVVDVFAQVCDEVTATTLAQLQEMVRSAPDAAKKKEYRIKMRAIEAYREELNSRLLQHVIHLNHWHSLRKRVRHVQREKLALREEIIRIKGEREQVALRMDAVRIKHEADTKQSKHCLDASTLMHNVDLVVEQAREAPELSRAVQKESELANLELLVAQVSEQASSSSFTGGMLNQVRDFNAFLERAAITLESR